MPLTTILTFYLSGQFLRWFLTVLIAFLFLGGMIDFLEMMGAAEKINQGGRTAFLFMLYRLPNFLIDYMPFVTLFAGVTCFLRLSESHTIAIIRAAGISVWQFLLPILGLTVLLGLVIIGVGDPLGSYGLQKFAAHKAALSGYERNFSATSSGMWLREMDVETPYIIKAGRFDNTDGPRLYNIMVLAYDRTGSFLYQADAPRADLIDEAWHIQKAHILYATAPLREQKALVLPTKIRRETLHAQIIDPDTLSVWQLPQQIETARATGNKVVTYQLRFHERISLPLFMIAMILIAAGFSLPRGRIYSPFQTIGGAVICGFTLFIAKIFIIKLSAINFFPVFWASWIPLLIAVFLAAVLLITRENG